MKLLQPILSKGLPLFALSFLFCFSAISQVPEGIIRCATVEMDSIRHAENPDLQTDEEFEEWLEKLIADKKQKQAQGLIINGVYQIPIIVHVVHNGEAIGVGRNLSVATIQSQIDVLNEDFRRIAGSNGFNTHPDGADTEIEFCLARRRPDGSAFPPGEDGINRIDATAQGWGGPTFSTTFINNTIKPFCTATQFGGWDPAVYMNFWSIDLQGGLLGYAQFPTTVLGGMGCNAQNVITDGVVMDYQTIGKAAVTGFPGPFNEGRTATHEVGHWLGLRHIWGDGGCGVDDFCNDTPLSDASNGGCPTGHVSCGSVDMIENYMDYTNDLCMNIFTNDQKMRMRTVLENSPIRASLITSDACIPPAVSDASITGIIDPDGDNCAGSITPTVTLRNRGSSNLTSVTIAYTLNNGAPTTFNWTGNIAPGAENNVVLPPFNAPLGIHDFRAYTELPNGVVDPDPTYDTTLIAFAVSNGLMPDQAEDFDGGVFPPNVRWNIDNPNDDCYEWVGQACVSSAGVANNVAAMMTNTNNGTNDDEFLYTPYFILPCNATAANVSFDKAYRRRVTGSNDRLRLEMSDDCGATWSNVLFDQSGNALDGPNGTSGGAYWIPTTAGEWQNVNIDLMPFVTGTSQSVQFRFRATNDGNGGNLFVDNFNFTATTPGEIEVTANGADVLDGGYFNYGAGPVGGTMTQVFTITNTGTSNLILTGPLSLTGDAEFAINSTFGTTTIPPGGSTTFSIDFTASGAGPFTGNISFGTNDCDEGVYNFELQGVGDVVPPTAAFTVAPNVICEGQTVTFTDASSAATSHTWTFPGGTPSSATGAGPHVVTYNTAGVYSAQLLVTNLFGNDTETVPTAVAVLGGAALPIAEGFDSGTFVPLGWQTGNGGSQAVNWTQDPNNNGTAPTPGNSARIDYYNVDNTNDQDTLFAIPADFSGLTSATLTFDVAYARYNGTLFDRLEVFVSSDCGATWTQEYLAEGTALATEPDQTGPYTAPSVWRNENINLDSYITNDNVQIAFVSTSGWGQFIYLDNINITGVAGCTDPDVPTLSATPSAVCNGNTSTINITGNLNDATDWQIYTGSCGGTNVGSTSTGSIVVTPTGPSTTYFIRGEGGCVVPGSCATVTIDVNDATSGSENVTACETYTWSANGTTYTSNGTYTATLVNAAGCDSTATLNLTINPLDNAAFSYGAASYCVNDADPTPTITGLGGGTFSSTAGLVINGSSGAIDVSASTPGTYTVTYTTSGACPNSSNVSVTINALDDPSFSYGAASYCVNDADPTPTITGLGGGAFSSTAGLVINGSSGAIDVSASTSGTYTVTYATSGACPNSSNVSVTINALDDPSFSYGAASYCVNDADPTPTITGLGGGTFSSTAGLAINGGSGAIDVSASTPGTYTVTYTTSGACPNSSNVSVTISGTSAGSENVTACNSFTWSANGTTYTTSGSYTATLMNAAGCDSVATLNLTITTFSTGTDVVSACNSFTWIDGNTYTTSNNTATFTIVGGSVNGCDSIVTLNLTINTPTSGSENVTACDTYTWSANGTTYTSSGTFTTTLTNAAGCDSTATLNLTINNSNSGSESVTACDSYTWSANGTTYASSGTFTTTLTNVSGCDSVATLNLTINNSTSGSESITACGNYTWPANGTTYTTSGSYTATLTNSQGCDSIATLNLTISSFSTGTDVVTACNSYTWIDGITYTSSNSTATFTLVGGSVNGCDSIVTLNLTLGNSSTGSETITSCGPYFWPTSGVSYASTGNFTTTVTNASGCDSVITLFLTVNNPTSGSETVSSCGPYFWATSGFSYASTGNFTATITNAAGCDSTVTLFLTVNSPTSGSESIMACDSYTWSANGTTYTTSGSYTATLTNAQGCDSTATLNLTINNSSTGSETVTACDTYTWSANGTTYTSSGTYTAVLTNTHGCDSTVTLNLTINNSTSGSESVSACDFYTWPANGTAYASSGIFTTTLTNAAGCDSIATLNLTINNSNSGSENVTACNSYTWSANGTTYTTGGSYTATLTNAQGCDSTATLNLTINNSSAGSENVTACDSYTWSANGTTYTTSGSYTATLTNAQGCDSLATLNLTVNNSTASTESVTACETYTWSTNGATYTSGGSFTATLTNAQGCDSIVTLNLTINSSSTATDVITACDSYTWIDGNTYTTSNTTATHIIAGGATNGCDSIVTLDLTINNSSTGTETVTACESYVWTADGNTYTATGTYTAVLTNSVGCDSTVTLDLTINDLPVVNLTLAIDEFCEDADPVSLSGGSPSVGNYSGAGVSAGVFTAANAGVGTHTITYEFTDANGCTSTATDEILVQDCSSLDEIQAIQVLLYPNPTTGGITLEATGVIMDELLIFDNAGKLIAEIQLSGETELIDLSDYARGVYQMQVKAGSTTFWERVVKH